MTPKLPRTIYLYNDVEAHDEGLSGIVVPYNQRARQVGYQLSVDEGAFAGRMPDVLVNVQHDKSRLIGRTGLKGNVNLTDTPGQLAIAMSYPDTQIGRDAKTEVELGILAGFSAEFTILSDYWNGGVRHIKEAVLMGIGLVARPAMSGAVILSADEIQVGGEIAFPFVELQKRSFSGEMVWNEISVASMARRQAVLFRPGSLDVEMPISLLLGSDYNTSAANTAADGSLTVQKTNRGISWKVDRLPRTENGGKILNMLSKGLILSWRPGFVAMRTKKRPVKVMGFDMELTEVEEAQLCDVRLISSGAPGSGPVRRSGRRRG